MPETYALADRLTAQWSLRLHRIPALRSIFQIYRDHGIDAPRRLLKDNLVQAMDSAAAELGIDGLILGMRADEARGRRANLASRGLIYRMVSGQIRCNPIGFWTGEDVWAYIVTYDIPYLPIYDDYARIGLDYTSPASRTSNWAGNFDRSQPDHGTRMHRLRWLRPELWNELVGEFPQFRRE
jgi:phosphoadenosine phosphosulfate reductase